MIRFYTYIFVLWLLLFLWSCENTETTGAPKAGGDPMPDQEMWNFDVRVTDQGKLEAHLKSGHMMLFNDKNNPYSILNQGVHVDFYDEDGNHASTLTADSGHYQDKTRDVKAFRNVVIVSDSGVTLHTEAIEYNQEKDKIFTDLEVLITTTQGDSFWGDGFESDPHMNNWQINRLYGIAHKGVNMSPEALERKKRADGPDSLNVTAKDSAVFNDTIPDSGNSDDEY